MFDRDKLAYLAGIIDGEGSIMIQIQGKNKSRKINYYSIRLLIINTYKPLMDWLLLNFGGNVIKRKKIENRRLCYVWHSFSFNASNTLEKCLPFLIEKKRHAEIIIEFMKVKPEGTYYVTPEIQQYREFLYNQLKKINSKEI